MTKHDAKRPGKTNELFNQCFLQEKGDLMMALMLYGCLGEKMFWDSLRAGELERMGELELQANVQFAVRAKRRGILYAVVSDAGAGVTGGAGTLHGLAAMRMEADGALTPLGEMLPLPERPIHLSIDAAENFLLVSFNKSGSLRVYCVGEDGAPAAEVEQEAPLRAGVFTHQAIFLPGNRRVLAVGRGNGPRNGRQEELGALFTFSFDEKTGAMQLLSEEAAPSGVGPRHFTLAPDGRRAYLAIERGSRLASFALGEEGLGEKLASVEILLNHANVDVPRQRGGVAALHPSGRFIYSSNRADKAEVKDGEEHLLYGENNLAAYEIAEDGSLTLLQHVPCRGAEARSLVTTDSLLIVGNQKRMYVDGGTCLEPTNIALFKIGADGRLEFLRRYETEEQGKKWLLWLDVFGKEEA